MANDEHLIKIILEQIQKGTGAKDTATDLEKLEQSAEAVEAVVRKVREEMAKLDGESRKSATGARAYADHLSNIAKEGRAYLEQAKAIAAAETKVGYANKDLGAGIYDTGQKMRQTEKAASDLNEELREQETAVDGSTRSIEKISRELEEARRELYKLEIGTDKFNEQQRRVATLSQERLVAETAAARGTGNAANAIFIASQGLEDMQYGIRGVLNNVPGLVTALGGSFGLAGVISILAVVLTNIIPLFVGAGDAAEKAARTVEIASERKLAAARRERELSRELEQQRALLDQQAQFQIDTLLDEVKAYDDLTAAIQRNYAQAQAVANEKLALDIALVQNDASLSSLDKAVKINQLKADAARQEEQRKLDELAAEAAALESKINTAGDDLNSAITTSATQQRQLNKDIETGVRQVENLKAEYEKLTQYFQDVTIKNVDKNINSPFVPGNGGVTAPFSPDRKDFGDGLPGDKAFLDAAKNDSLSGTPARNDIDSALRLYQQLEQLTARINQLEGEVNNKKKERTQLENRSDSYIDTLNSEIEGGQKRLDQLAQEIADKKEIIELSEKRRQVEGAAGGASAATAEVQKEVAELGRDLDADLAASGATKEEIAAARAKYAEVSRNVAEALKDGVIDAGEFSKISNGLDELRRVLTSTADASNKNMVELLSAARAQQKFQETLQLQIRQQQLSTVSP